MIFDLSILGFGKKKNRPILVVDDELAILIMIQEIIKDADYTVIGARTGPDAVKAAQSALPQLILLDIMMPKVDGLQTLELLKSGKSTRDIPVVMITARSTAGDIEKAYSLGAVGYIIKPFDNEKLLAQVKRFANPRS